MRNYSNQSLEHLRTSQNARREIRSRTAMTIASWLILAAIMGSLSGCKNHHEADNLRGWSAANFIHGNAVSALDRAAK